MITGHEAVQHLIDIHGGRNGFLVWAEEQWETARGTKHPISIANETGVMNGDD
jgi:hypothetical protein